MTTEQIEALSIVIARIEKKIDDALARIEQQDQQITEATH